MPIITEELIELLVCPKCKGKLEMPDGALICQQCQLAYPVRDGVPVMLMDEAVPLQEAEREAERGSEQGTEG